MRLHVTAAIGHPRSAITLTRGTALIGVRPTKRKANLRDDHPHAGQARASIHAAASSETPFDGH